MLHRWAPSANGITLSEIDILTTKLNDSDLCAAPCQTLRFLRGSMDVNFTAQWFQIRPLNLLKATDLCSQTPWHSSNSGLHLVIQIHDAGILIYWFKPKLLMLHATDQLIKMPESIFSSNWGTLIPLCCTCTWTQIPAMWQELHPFFLSPIRNSRHLLLTRLALIHKPWPDRMNSVFPLTHSLFKAIWPHNVLLCVFNNLFISRSSLCT